MKKLENALSINITKTPYNSYKLDELRTERIGEFRKNVALRIFYQGKEINVDLERLKDYAEKLEKFISTTKQFLLSK